MMVIQSIVLYSTLILVMVSLAKLYALQSGQLVSRDKIGESKSGILLIVFIILSFSVMMGLRYDVGTDYLAYQEGYIFNFDVGKGEILFNLIRTTFNFLNLHYTVYFSFLAFLNIFFFLFAFKRDSFILPLLLFFVITNGDWLFWMNGIRQAIAMCIWIYALQYIEKKIFWKYLLWCLVAIGFHSSAVILIPFYFVLKNGKDYFKNIKFQLILFISALLLQYLFVSFLDKLQPLIQFYQSELTGGAYNYSFERLENEATATVQGSGLAYVFKIMLSVIIIFFSRRLKGFYNSNWFNIVYFIFFIGILAQYSFPTGSVVLTRPFRYLFAFQGVMFAYFAYYLIRQVKLSKKIFGITLVLIFLAIFYLNLMSANIDSNLWYQFYFQQ